MRKFFLIAGALVTLVIIYSQVALAHLAPRDHVGFYLWRQQTGINQYDRGDPTNIVITWSGDTYNAVNHFYHHHTNWNNTEGSDFWHLEHCCRDLQVTQRANDCGTCDRYHIRFYTGSWDDNNGLYTTAAVHHDVNYECTNGRIGHVGQDYDQLKVYVANNMAAGGHYNIAPYWDNTDPAYQPCIGKFIGNNGYVRYIDARP
jgi:hypothetical protein